MRLKGRILTKLSVQEVRGNLCCVSQRITCYSRAVQSLLQSSSQEVVHAHAWSRRAAGNVASVRLPAKNNIRLFFPARSAHFAYNFICSCGVTRDWNSTSCAYNYRASTFNVLRYAGITAPGFAELV